MSEQNNSKKKSKQGMFHETEISIGGEKLYMSPALKLILAWTIFIILLIIFMLIVKGGADKKEQAGSTGEDGVEQVVTQDTQGDTTEIKSTGDTSVDTSVTVPMEVNAYPDINNLINAYLTATCTLDVASLKAVVTNPGEFDDMATLQARAQYITGYSNVQCYTKVGPEPDSFVVFVVSNMTIANVATAPMEFMTLYVIKTENGYLINNNILTDDITGYIANVKKDSDIQTVMLSVTEYNKQAMESDAGLKAFYDMLAQ